MVRPTRLPPKQVLIQYSCGVPLYSNRPRSICKNCNTERDLALNPRIIGPLADETGSVAMGKLIWSDKAWTELFFGNGTYRPNGSPDTASDLGYSWQELVSLEQECLRAAEEQLQYSRVILIVGWSPEVGRLSVLGVEW